MASQGGGRGGHRGGGDWAEINFGGEGKGGWKLGTRGGSRALLLMHIAFASAPAKVCLSAPTPSHRHCQICCSLFGNSVESIPHGYLLKLHGFSQSRPNVWLPLKFLIFYIFIPMHVDIIHQILSQHHQKNESCCFGNQPCGFQTTWKCGIKQVGKKSILNIRSVWFRNNMVGSMWSQNQRMWSWSYKSFNLPGQFWWFRNHSFLTWPGSYSQIHRNFLL